MKRTKDKNTPKYAEMLSSVELASMLGVSVSHARRVMEQMPHINSAMPGSKRRMLRVYKKDAVALYCANDSANDTGASATKIPNFSP